MREVLGHIKGTAFQEGPLIGKKWDLSSFVEYPENAPRLSLLNKRLKLYHGEETWFAVGTYGQLWEYGVASLGFTVRTSRMIGRALEAGFKATQRGDSEANFLCHWTDDDLAIVILLLKLRTRRPTPPNAFLKHAHSYFPTSKEAESPQGTRGVPPGPPTIGRASN